MGLTWAWSPSDASVTLTAAHRDHPRLFAMGHPAESPQLERKRTRTGCALFRR